MMTLRTMHPGIWAGRGWLIIVATAFMVHARGAGFVGRDQPRDTLPALRREGVVELSVAHVCHKLGLPWQYDPHSRMFTCSTATGRVRVIEGNMFAECNDSIVQLPNVPRRFGAGLYLDAIALASLWRHVVPDLVWQAESTTLRISSPPPPVPVLPEAATKTVVKPAAALPSGPVTTAEPVGAGHKIRTIVIDPGHGGKDPGAVGPGGVYEKDIVLAIGLALRDLLRKNGGFTVHMTRSTDVFVPLARRTRFANEKQADLFISIHCNSIGGTKAKKIETQGYKIYFLSQEKNEEDKLVAMKENSVIELETESERGDYLQDILINMAGNEYLAESQDLSIMIEQSLDKSVKEISKLHRGVGQARFYVLNGAYMPAVLVESAFISNPYEERILSNSKVQHKIAKAIYEAIVRFKKKYEV